MEEPKISENLSKVVKYFIDKGKNKSQIAAEWGLNPNLIDHFLKGVEPGGEKIRRILSNSNIRHEFLFWGKGKMFRDENEGKTIVVTVNPENEETGIYVPVSAHANYLTGHSDPGFLEKLPAVSIPFFSIKGMRLFEVAGDSMEPTLFEMDILICEMIEGHKSIRNGRMYVVVTMDEGIVVKRVVYNKGDSFVMLSSDNKFYESYQVNLSEIMELWYVRRRFTGQLPPPSTIEERLAQLESAFFNIIAPAVKPLK